MISNHGKPSSATAAVPAMTDIEKLKRIRRMKLIREHYKTAPALESVQGEPEMCLACNLGHDVAECKAMATGLVTFESPDSRTVFSDRSAIGRPPTARLNKELAKWRRDAAVKESEQNSTDEEARPEPAEPQDVEGVAEGFDDSYLVTAEELQTQCKESWSKRDQAYDLDGEPVQKAYNGSRGTSDLRIGSDVVAL